MKSLTCAIAVASLCLVQLLHAQERGPLRNLTGDGLAFSGFDPVSCFPAGGARVAQGLAQYEVKFEGARYLFASAAHRAWFEAEPGRYEPAFGGFDAGAMAAGERKSATPAHFKVSGARLFVFNEASAATKFEAALAAQADGAWKRLSGESPRGTEVDDARVGVKWNLGKDQLALEGFDPVGYFPEGGGAALPGDPGIETILAGARYRFASTAHRTWFLAEPARYRPKYGGWCAYAMVDGDEVEIDPKSFLVENGRLLLFYKGLFADTRAKWIPKAQELAPKADAAWAKIGRK